MKHVDLEKPTQFLDQVNLRCTQHDCKPNKNLVDEYRKMFESLTSAGAVERLPRSGDVHAKITAWTQDIEGRAKKCVKRYFEPANKNSEQLLQVSTPCIDDHQFKKEDGGDLERFYTDLEVASCVFSGVERSYQEIGTARKQSSVSHSTTESEIMSFDAGLRLDGSSALDLWDLVIEVLYIHARSDFGAKKV